MPNNKSWLRGYQSQISGQYLNEKLPHAILVSGLAGSGKSELISWLVEILSCQQLVHSIDGATACGHCKSCHLNKAGTHPDIKQLSGMEKSISVDSIRNLTAFVEKTAQISGNKIIVIDECEKLTESAANALLKTLEEPTSKTYIILSCQDRESLLATIISRCYTIQIQPPTGKALLDAVYSDEQQGNKFVNLSQLPQLIDEELKQRFQTLLNLFVDWSCFGGDKQELLVAVTENDKALAWLLQLLQSTLRIKQGWPDALIVGVNSQHEFSQRFSVEELWQLYNLLLIANKRTKSRAQLNTQMSNEQLLFDIETLLKGEVSHD